MARIGKTSVSGRPPFDNYAALDRLIVHGIFEKIPGRKMINKAANDCLPMFYIYSVGYLLSVISHVVKSIGAD